MADAYSVDDFAERFIDGVTNRKGLIRLSHVRECFRWNYLKEGWGRQLLSRCYSEWVNTDEYLWFAVIDKRTGEKVRELCSKCSKRGNDVYRWRLKKRLGWLEDIEEEEFFDPNNREVHGEATRILFVVLTYDTSRCSRREAWETINHDWNRWISAVRSMCGRVKCFKTFEAFKNGYPHVNAVLVFQDDQFVISHKDKNGKFRILREVKDWFDSLWHSHVDVQACYSTGVFGYLKKYMLKTYGERNDVKGINRCQARLTVALLWLFRKQSFSLSGGMQELILDLIEEKHNSNSFPFQMTLEGDRENEIRLIDVVTLEELFLSGKPPPDLRGKWSFEFSPIARVKLKLSRTGGSCQLGLSFYCPR